MVPQVISAKTSPEAAGTTTVWHSHDVVQIGFMRAGIVRIDFPQRSVHVEGGGLFAIAPRHLHRITNVTAIEIHEVFAEMTAEPRNWGPRALAAASFAACVQASVIAPDAGALDAVAVALVRHQNAGTIESSLVADGLLLQLLVEARSLPHQVIACSGNPDCDVIYPARLLDAIRLVERSYHDPDTTVAWLAERLHMHRSALFRLFRRHVGHGPGVFMTHYRLDRARELLGHPDRRIGEIAYAVGFRDPATFCRAVRRRTGMTPSQVREELGRS